MPYINLISTSNPATAIPQSQIAGFMEKAMRLNTEESRKLKAVFRMSGIKKRHTVIQDYLHNNDQEWTFYPKLSETAIQPGTEQRMHLFEKFAMPLAEKAINPILNSHTSDSFTHLITVSCTGMFAPGLDIQLIKKLGLNKDIERTSIQFMGCFAAFNALKSAYHICRSEPHSKVLILCVELCTLHFQSTFNEDNLLANTLFGDGAAAVVVSNDAAGAPYSIEGFQSVVDGDSEQEMAWHIGNLGFEMKLSSYVPDVIEKNIAWLSERLMKKFQLLLEDIDYYAIHPGGKRILAAVEKGLGLPKSVNDIANEVLENFGNMSSPTVLFVLDKLGERINPGKKVLSFAFGPGLTMESMLLKSV
ncbi:type III polyketide synthase [Marivirga sp. S37H4]|uniref:Type III polyketide synthase n=1 Tax=Marivirga aurantiaca TaxID=2802615 RepID=A0A934X2L2_9BACT|nr:type III polyketide synthase [Marivirga aurantiaca]MBK6267136.1 type III polyketide synthase [Marivirga aurantiaca]